MKATAAVGRAQSYKSEAIVLSTPRVFWQSEMAIPLQAIAGSWRSRREEHPSRSICQRASAASAFSNVFVHCPEHSRSDNIG